MSIAFLYLNFLDCSIYKPCLVTGDPTLTPKGPWVPYVEFSDSGKAAMNAFYF
jgi:hypothetical protein